MIIIFVVGDDANGSFLSKRDRERGRRVEAEHKDINSIDQVTLEKRVVESFERVWWQYIFDVSQWKKCMG
jgi:hypothetical protein